MTSTVTPPRAVVFDLGGVVCRFLPARRLQAMAQAADLSTEAVQTRLWDSGFDRDCDRGRYDAAGMVAQINARLGCRLTADEAGRLWTLAFEPERAVLALVGAVREHRPTALLTDNGALLHEALPAHLPRVAEAFGPLMFSCQFGRLKDDPELFRLAAARLGLPGPALVLVDDSPTALTTAAAAGWQTLAFTDATQTGAALWARLGLPVTS
ncbi:MAG TPA: HAD-IA family hydrolase [bacterium]|nr:HAD-IA family hydrolase [bacterium]